MKYLFYLAKEYSIPVVEPLVCYLDNRQFPDSTYRFFISPAIADKVPVHWNRQNILCSLKAAIQYKPDAVVCPGNYVDHRIPGIKVQIFHGVGIEKPSHYQIRGFFDLYLTSGPFVTERYKALKQKHKYFNVAETGWPKFDHILGYPDKYDLPNLPSNYGKVILYAPTFSRRMQSAGDLLPILPKTIHPDELWLIKFHELMSPEFKNIRSGLNNQNVVILQQGDITPYLHAADIMISDTSSVIYEFLCLNKPVITYKTLGNLHKGVNITEPNQLRAALDQLLEDPQYQLSKRLKALEEVNPYIDGNISKRVFTAIENFDNALIIRKKPLNLFRKGKILFTYYFNKGRFE